MSTIINKTDGSGNLLTSLATAIPTGANAIGGVTGAGSNSQIKDDTFYGDGITAGVFSTHLRLFNGTNYDRLRGDTTNGAWVNVKSIVSLPSGTNSIGSVTANAGTNLNTSTLALESGGNLATIAGGIATQGTALGTVKNFLMGGSVTTNAPSYTTGNINPFSLDTSGLLRVSLKDTPSNTNNLNVSIANSSIAVTESGNWTVQPGNTANTTPWLMTPTPTPNSGWSFNYQSALTNSVIQIKSTAGTFGGYVMLYNPNTAVTYIQVFNKASASVTLGTTVPDFVIPLPGVASASATGSAANAEIVCGIAMGTGISIAATTTPSGSTAPSNTIVATFLYK